jgi:cbb3-type cytochrome oxidase maturation protein
MSVLYIALPIAIALGAGAMWACVRCIRTGQFDDLESPAIRMLIDDHPGGEGDAEPPRSDPTTGER